MTSSVITPSSFSFSLPVLSSSASRHQSRSQSPRSRSQSQSRLQSQSQPEPYSQNQHQSESSPTQSTSPTTVSQTRPDSPTLPLSLFDPGPESDTDTDTNTNSDFESDPGLDLELELTPETGPDSELPPTPPMAAELSLLRVPDIACWLCRREIEESAACRVVTFPAGEEGDAVVSPVGRRATSVREGEGEREEGPVFVIPVSVPISVPDSTPVRGPVPIPVPESVGRAWEAGMEKGVEVETAAETEVGTQRGTDKSTEKGTEVGTKSEAKHKTLGCGNGKEAEKEVSGSVYQNGVWTFRVHADCWGTFPHFIYLRSGADDEKTWSPTRPITAGHVLGRGAGHWRRSTGTLSHLSRWAPEGDPEPGRVLLWAAGATSCPSCYSVRQFTERHSSRGSGYMAPRAGKSCSRHCAKRLRKSRRG